MPIGPVILLKAALKFSSPAAFVSMMPSKTLLAHWQCVFQLCVHQHA